MRGIILLSAVLLIGIKSGLSQVIESSSERKMNGMSMVAINDVIDSSNILPLKTLNANWAAVIPFAFMPSHTSPQLSFDLDWQWKGERIEGVRNYIQELHAQNIAVMIKPQIWIGHGTYTGKIFMETEKDWLELESNYQKYILAFAQLANEEGAEILCIGTELKFFAQDRPQFWRELISDLRKVYSGKLTYAGNWDDFDNVQFWNDLDYIGVDAYFPIATGENSTVKELVEGWTPHKNLMDSISNQNGKPILFTEYGYRSISGCAIKPWDYSDEGKQDEKAQCLALEAFYEMFWSDENYSGGFLWKWYPDHAKAGGAQDKMFTVQNKRAEKTVKEAYSK